MARTNSLPTTRPAGNLPACRTTDRRYLGCWVSVSPAVRRHRTSHQAVRSPRRLGKPTKKRQFWRGIFFFFFFKKKKKKKGGKNFFGCRLRLSLVARSPGVLRRRG